MKCPECGADIYEGIKKCPYCKTLIGAGMEDEKFKNFDFKYTITSTEQVKKILLLIIAFCLFVLFFDIFGLLK